jgi:hypothetical protein
MMAPYWAPCLPMRGVASAGDGEIRWTGTTGHGRTVHLAGVVAPIEVGRRENGVGVPLGVTYGRIRGKSAAEESALVHDQD